MTEHTIALTETKVELVPITAVKPNSYNPNVQQPHDFQLLLDSIRDDGFTQPIIVHRPTMEIVDGEHRWKAARQLGMDTIPVVFVTMTEEQRRVATLTHNRARGDEDVSLAAALLRDLRDNGDLAWAADSLALEDVEVRKLLTEIAPPDVTGPNGEVNTPEVRAEQARLNVVRQEEERAQAKIEQRIFRLSLTFTPEEGKIVRTALGSSPATRVVEICRKALEAQR